MIWSILALAAAAEPAPRTDVGLGSTAFVPRPVAGWPVAELRGGVSGLGAGAAPMICGEVAPYRLVALDACGSGAGFLYPAAPGTIDVTHFRAEATITAWQRGRTELFVQPGVGFAEIQRGQDAPGFAFGRARADDAVEGAGAEAAIAAKAREWVSPRVDVTGEIVLGAAYVPSAPAVLGGAPTLVFATASVGAGF